MSMSKFLAVLLFSSALLTAADLPSAESLLATSVERSGGKAYTEAKSLHFSGIAEMVGHNISGPVAIWQTRSKTYMGIELAGLGRIEEGSNGDVTWELNAMQGPRLLEGEEREALKRAEQMAMLASWRDFYTDARTVGSDDVNGKPAWKIELKPKIGKTEYMYLDKTSGLTVRMTQTIATALGEINVDTVISGYREVQGIQTPTSLLQTAMGQNMKLTFDKAEYNIDIPDSTFALPPSVKALVDKRKAQ